VREWFDNEGFWRDLYPLLAKRFAAATEETEKLLALTKPRGNAVLDLGCGPGRHALALARRGFAEVKLYGNFDGGDYGINAQRLIAVGSKAHEQRRPRKVDGRSEAR
jgi:hypothetical protein